MSGCSTKLGCKPGIFVVFSVVFSTCFLGTTPRVKHPIGNENPKWHESGFFVRSRASRLCRFEGRMADLDIDTISCVTVLHKDFGTDSETVSAASDVGVSVGPAGDEH